VADEGLRRPAAAAIGALLACLGVIGCGGASSGADTAASRRGQEPPARPFPEAPEQWWTYHSVRFRMSIPLPSPRTWKIDDRSHEELVAREASTHSTLTVLSENEPALVNHQLCEARARTLGLVPEGTLQPIEDVLTAVPPAYDTRVSVAIEKGRGAEKKLVGHLFAFGAHVRKCLVVHLATEVASEDDEQALSQRLAIARLRTLGGLKIDELESVPRGKAPP
jgi:hypothetical protein